MVNFLKEWVLNLITIVIFIILLEMILPSGKLKKFINLVSGFILIIAVIKPFVGGHKIAMPLEDFQIINSNYVDKKSLEQNSKMMEEEQIRQVTEVYRNKLAANIKERLEKIDEIWDVEADLTIDEDNNSENYGEVKKVFLKFKLYDKDYGQDNSVSNIEKIEIKVGEKEKPEEIFDEKIKEEVETIIINLLQIKSEDIIILMEKG